MARNPGIPVDEMDDFLARKKAQKEAEAAKPKTEGEFNIVMEPEGLYRVEHASGRGALPLVLQGRFTNISRVQAIINNYKAGK